MLTDWTDEDPGRVMAKLKKQSGYYNHHKRTVGDFIDDVSKQGWSAAVADRKMWAEMKMNPTDLGRRQRRYLHLPHEWPSAERQLDRYFQAW
jgi:hypothetical protein